jgi:hypothetical protein
MAVQAILCLDRQTEFTSSHKTLCQVGGWGMLENGHITLVWGLPATSPGVVLLPSAVNFDHFQILRAIGKGSFGKVRRNLWVGQASRWWASVGLWGWTALHLSGEASPHQAVGSCL